MVIEKTINANSIGQFEWTLRNHRFVLEALENEPSDDEDEDESDKDPVPKLRYAEVQVILAESLKVHFAHELARVVCTKAIEHSTDANPSHF